MKQIPNLPSPLGMKKDDIIDLLLREEYGYLPPRPLSVSAEVVSTDKQFCAGQAYLYTLKLTCQTELGEYSFPVYYSVSKYADKPLPAFIHLNFRDMIPDRYQPTEEIIDNGYAILTIYYKDVSSDDGDFTNGLAGVVYPDGKRHPDQCGKIGLWAWATMAVLDYAFTLPELNHEKISVVGHSRLGKTALLAGALDERFFCAISNDSGCSGAALSRQKGGESVRRIYDKFPYWFCENFKKYCDNEDSLPFDQHFLLAANTPHLVYVASADEDSWADPMNEYLSCVEADKYYQSLGLSGFIHPDRMPSSGDTFHEGTIGYHLRKGAHYLSRHDWLTFIQFLNAHSK